MNIVVLTNFYKDIIYRFALFELNLLFFEDYTVLWNEFAAEVPEGSARSVALQLLPECRKVFSGYTLSDDFMFSPEFERLYDELTGTVVIWLEENGL